MSDPTDGDQRKSIRRLGSKASGSAASGLLPNAPEETPRDIDRTETNEPRSQPLRPSLDELGGVEAERPGLSSNNRPRYDRRQRSRSR